MIKDKERIRGLAEQVASICEGSEKKTELWYDHNQLVKGRPLVLVFPESAWQELLPVSSLICADPLARNIEWKLLSRLYHYHHFHDDMVFEKRYRVPKKIRYRSILGDWFTTDVFHFHTGLCAPVSHSEMNPEMGFIPVSKYHETQTRSWGSSIILSNLKDLENLFQPEVLYQEKESQLEWEKTCDLLGDSLDVELTGMVHISFHFASTYVDLRGGLMNMLMDFYDYPDLIHQTMSFLVEACLDLIRQYEMQGLFSRNSGNIYHSTGGLTHSRELTGSADKITTADLWASAEAQELSEVSPGMFEEFVLPYEKRVLSLFGLNGYGCCEPLDDKLGSVLTLPNLRRISCSPSADIRKFAQKIGDRYILSWKPNPAMLVGDFVPSFVEKYVKEGLDAAKGCIIEIILKDLMTLPSGVKQIEQWLEIVNHLIGKERQRVGE